MAQRTKARKPPAARAAQAVRPPAWPKTPALDVRTGAEPIPSRFGHDLSRILIHAVPAGTVQAKPAISRPGDCWEQEADRIADDVMRSPEPAVTLSASVPQQMTSPAMAHSPGRTGTGRPLPQAELDYFQPRLGHDFSQVRIHDDSRAGESARTLGAVAYTAGHDIVFAPGQFTPASDQGRRLLAHELAHVVQQSGPGPSSPEAPVAIQRRTGVPRLQGFWVTEEPAGGCGICYGEVSPKPAAEAGKWAHGAVQWAFREMLGAKYRLTEFPYQSPTGSGRLDLAVATPTGFKIGEIKPANKQGEEDGIKDLDWYRTTLQAAYPNSTIELLDERVSVLAGLKMPDLLATASGCQLQTLGLTVMRPGLYGYWCEPPFKVARRRCRCKPGAGERESLTVMEVVEDSLTAAAITARLTGDVEGAVRIERAAEAIFRGLGAVVETAEAAGEAVWTVRAIQFMEEVFE